MKERPWVDSHQIGMGMIAHDAHANNTDSSKNTVIVRDVECVKALILFQVSDGFPIITDNIYPGYEDNLTILSRVQKKYAPYVKSTAFTLAISI